jgi:hypothetical protein
MANSKSDASSRADNSAAEAISGRPDVIVEFLFDRGSFHIAIRNIGDRPALGVSVKFSRKFTGASGDKEFSELPLFKNIEFLGPGREITTFLDTSHSYFRRKQPKKLSAQISYHDSFEREYETTIKHDLEIYRGILYLTEEGDCAD